MTMRQVIHTCRVAEGLRDFHPWKMTDAEFKQSLAVSAGQLQAPFPLTREPQSERALNCMAAKWPCDFLEHRTNEQGHTPTEGKRLPQWQAGNGVG